jgi:galactokinase
LTSLTSAGIPVGGFNLNIEGAVPIGSGLSSSAAVECATAFALNEVFQLGIPKSELVFIAQKAEHEFVGVLCGIMDQFASMFGKKDRVIRLDCRSLDYKYEPLALDGYKILLLNTNVKHSLASSEYNTRRQECLEGVEMIRAEGVAVTSLRDVSMEMLEKHVRPKNELIYKRCKYVVEENQRLITGCEELEKGNLEALGEKIYGSHEGLSKEYEVSCKELDFLVEAVRYHPGVVGARMMGGGFGGCTINIVRDAAIDELIDKTAAAYQQAMGMELTAYVVETADGTSVCE